MNKVLLLVPTDANGGSEHVLKMVGEELLARKLLVTVFCFLNTNNNFWDVTGFRVIKGSSIASSIFEFLKLVAFNRWDIVFASQSQINATVSILRFLKVLRTKKLFIRESTMVYSRFKGAKLLLYSVCHLTYGRADMTICQSSQMKDDFIKNVGRRWLSRRVVVFKNPIDLKKLELKSRGYAVSINGKYIVGMGRLIEEKGFDYLIRAFNQILIHEPTFKLVIIGDGDKLKELYRLVDNLGLGGSVIFKGYLSNPFPYILNADCCVVSSIVEGYPNVLLQMLALNRRVVSTDCAGGLRDIPNLRLVSTKDIDGLAENVVDLLKLRDTELEENYTLNCEYLSQYTVGEYVNKLIDI